MTGAPYYQAPELSNEQIRKNSKLDMFSLGVTLFNISYNQNNSGGFIVHPYASNLKDFT